ncbi:MAG TPA: hypothetical protein VIF62_35385 [Labilithrix sp.]|jgi:hypothetical protein
MQPFRAPGEIPACSRCGVRLEAAAVKRDEKGFALCPPCFAKYAGAAQDQKVLTVWLPIVFGFSLLLVLMIFGAIALFLYRHVGP